jgi:membrane-bound inhibitor of C-type lysozyme
MIVLAALVACGGAKQDESSPRADTATASTAPTASPSIVMLCGADTISVAGAPGDTLQLHVSGETFTVSLVPSASGAKYQAGADTSTFYWNQGNQALVQVHGDPLPACESIPGA